MLEMLPVFRRRHRATNYGDFTRDHSVRNSKYISCERKQRLAGRGRHVRGRFESDRAISHYVCDGSFLLSRSFELVSYESVLFAYGMMESLWPGTESEHATFITRAVLVIDPTTNLDLQHSMAVLGLSSVG